eukprot:c21781_g2_i4.p1 GENE.c21781_g2_i4~~c21781_g2_i4.p1  ORF type:complete len:1195 (-),score=423.79 c21781_g2_i4:71-3343(-)
MDNIDLFISWCEEVLEMHHEDLFLSSLLHDLEEISNQLHFLHTLVSFSKSLFKNQKYKVQPVQLVSKELHIDSEIQHFKAIADEKKEKFEFSIGTYFAVTEDPIDVKIAAAIASYCPQVLFRRHREGIYEVDELGFIGICSLNDDFVVRFQEKWISFETFFVSIHVNIMRNIPSERPGTTAVTMNKIDIKAAKGQSTGLIGLVPRIATLGRISNSFDGGSLLNKLFDSIVFQGQWLQVVNKKGQLESRYVKVVGSTPETLTLTWFAHENQQSTDIINNFLGRQSVKLSDGVEIRRGQKTVPFEKCDSIVHKMDDRSFSFLFRRANSNSIVPVDFICVSTSDQVTWMKDLTKATTLANKHAFSKQERSIVEVKWKQLNPSGSITSITKPQVRKLFKELHIRVGKKELDSLMALYDQDHDDRWTKNDFEKMVLDLETTTRPEIKEIINKHAGNKEYFTSLELLKFIANTQRENIGWSEIIKLIKIYELPLHDTVTPEPAGPAVGQPSARKKRKHSHYGGPENKSHTMKSPHEGKMETVRKLVSHLPISNLGTLAFVRYLKADENRLFDVQKSVTKTDLNRPLNEYYIASSHNTYLLGAQYLAVSSVEAYINALRRGARCLELDLHDGTADCPIIVTHGGARTSQISFEAVCKTINEYAFEKYKTPVILSLESHLSKENQKVCAGIFRSVFKEKLVLASFDENMRRLPTPRELQGHILLKGKAAGMMVEPNEVDEPENNNPRLSVDDPKELNSKDSKDFRELNSKDSKDFKELNSKDSKDFKDLNSKEMKELKDMKKPGMSKTFSFTKGHKSNNRNSVDSDFYQILFLKALKVRNDIKSLEGAKERARPNNMSSFPDTAVDHLATDPEKFTSFCSRVMTRVYPNPLNPKSWVSANFSPIQAWNCGAQCAALNYQTFDTPMQLNDAFFQQNGKTGYVCKPDFLCDPERPFNFLQPEKDKRLHPIRLKIIIISGQNFQFPKSSDTRTIDPFVVVQVLGIPVDKGIEVTEAVHENGFNPIWNCQMEFTIYCQELALLHIQVIDRDETIEDTPLGYYCIAVDCMKEGYRHFPLKRVTDGSEISPFCTLFCYVQKDRL